MLFIYASLWDPGMPELFQKFGMSKIYNVFLKKCFLRIKAAVIWSKQQKNNSNIMKYYCNLK